MSVALVEVKKNTRGRESREVTFKAIGRYVTKVIQRETQPVLNEDGSPKLDDKGEPVTEYLPKDDKGKQITREEKVQVLETNGVLTDLSDAMELAVTLVGDGVVKVITGKDEKGNDVYTDTTTTLAEQFIADRFVEGYNDWAYAREADKDELDDFIRENSMQFNDEQSQVFKRTVRTLSKNVGIEVAEAAQAVKAMMDKKKVAA